MKLARAIYVALVGFHMFNHYSLYKSLKTLDAKRVEHGETLSEDEWGCHWGKKKEWKNKRGNRNVNNTGSSSETAS